jgi:hypothetical protein
LQVKAESGKRKAESGRTRDTTPMAVHILSANVFLASS